MCPMPTATHTSRSSDVGRVRDGRCNEGHSGSRRLERLTGQPHPSGGSIDCAAGRRQAVRLRPELPRAGRLQTGPAACTLDVYTYACALKFEAAVSRFGCDHCTCTCVTLRCKRVSLRFARRPVHCGDTNRRVAPTTTVSSGANVNRSGRPPGSDADKITQDHGPPSSLSRFAVRRVSTWLG